MIIPTTSDSMRSSHDETSWNHLLEKEPSKTIIVDVLKVYPDRMQATVSFPNMEDMRLSYNPESGIIEGCSALAVSYSGVFIIERIVTFDCPVEDSVIFDVDKDNLIESLYVNDSASVEDEYEDTVSEPVVIKHAMGEKILSYLFSGIKLGDAATTIFFGLFSKIRMMKSSIIVRSRKVALEAGLSRIILKNSSSGKGGYSLSIVDKDEDQNDISNKKFLEFKGDVKEFISLHNISFEESMIDIPSVENMISLELAMDYEIEKYAQEKIEVSHEYKNRKLSIIGGSSDSIMINDGLLSDSGIKVSSYRGIKGLIGDREVIFTVFKSVSYDGDSFEYYAGKKTVVSDEIKELSIDKNTYVLGNTNYSYQGSYRHVCFPVSTSGMFISDRYHKSRISNFGKYNEKMYQEAVYSKINSHTEYEVDLKSGIANRDYTKTQNKTIEGTNLSIVLSEDEDVGFPSYTSLIKSSDGKEIVERKDINGIPKSSVVIKSDTQDSAIFSISSLESIIKTSNKVSILSNNALISGENTVIDSRLTVTKGFTTSGEFRVSATDIILAAENRMILTAKEESLISSNSLSILADESMYMRGPDNLSDDEGKSLQTSSIFFGSTVSIVGERIQIQAADSAYLVAKELVALSARSVSVPNTQ